nr:30S ribosomal protein S20 [Lachnospiraceae bacterium]
KKRIRTSEKRAARNKSQRSAVKTAMKKVYAAVDANDREAADAALKNAISVVEKAGSKGIYHKNNISRKVSHMTKAVNQMEK